MSGLNAMLRGGGAFAGLGLDFSGGAARDRLHRGGARAVASGPVTSSSPSNGRRDPRPGSDADRRRGHGGNSELHDAIHRFLLICLPRCDGVRLRR